MPIAGSKVPWLPRSIALRITLWYLVSAIALISVSTGFLYWTLVTNLEEEDTRTLSDNLENLRLLVQSAPAGTASDALGSPQEQAQVYVRVLDENGKTILETPGMTDEVRPPPLSELKALASARRSKRQLIAPSGKLFEIVSAQVPAGRDGQGLRYLQVAIDQTYERQLLARYRNRLWLVLMLSVIACALVGYVIARSGIQPIESISLAARRVGSATLNERIRTAGLPAELSGLADTFNDMLDRIEASFARVSQFSDDVAHELRTPINNLRGEIEVALNKARTEENYRDVLGSCLEECNRITRIIHSLLFLARAESTPSFLHLEQVDVREELEAVKDFFEASATEAGITLEVSAGAGLSARLDRTLFRQAVSNLVSNAIAHTPAGGSVVIRASDAGACLDIEVADTGSGISSEHLPHVFDRFYRADKARSGSQHNVGLGLAVVKSIVTQHRGCVDVRSRVGEGTTFRVQLPRSA